ncbi:wax ester/triacylglycerol synthase domain-containing protein [Streptomyces sp. NPDC051162]|uniref:wax ester/triacylglycerol synthase domain-containing protein n=1 Tax=unclassified Streptomyces TaxID=2593676 RepID=UPI00344294E5
MSDGTHAHAHPPALIDRAMRSFPVHHPDAQLRIGALLHLTGTAPPVGRLRDHVAERLPALPALTHFLTDTSSGWTRAWYADPAVHVVEHVLPPGREHLEREVQRLIRVPLPEGAPHWRLDLLRGHEPGRYAVLYLVHHAMQDGAGILHTLETLFTARGIPDSESSAVVPGLSPAPPVMLRDRFRALATTARTADRSVIWASARHPLSARRTFRWARVPVERLREVGHARGGSVNDAYLATLAHAVQDWAGGHWPPARRSAELPLIMPANLRRPEEAAAPGNKVAMVRLALPGGDVPLTARLDGAIRATAPLRSPRHREALRRAASLSYVPAWLLPRLLRAVGRPDRATVGVSGLLARHDLHLGEDPVTHVLPVGCLPEASPFGSLMLTYRGVSTACFMTDRALPGLDSLHLRWRRAVEG